MSTISKMMRFQPGQACRRRNFYGVILEPDSGRLHCCRSMKAEFIFGNAMNSAKTDPPSNICSQARRADMKKPPEKPLGGLFIAAVKRKGPYGRSWHLITSPDFEHWQEHGLIFHADQVDQENGNARLRRFFDDPAYLKPIFNRPTRSLCVGSASTV